MKYTYPVQYKIITNFDFSSLTVSLFAVPSLVSEHKVSYLDLLSKVRDSVQHLYTLLHPLVDDGQVVPCLLSHSLCLNRVRISQVFEVVNSVHTVLLLHLDVVFQGLKDSSCLFAKLNRRRV